MTTLYCNRAEDADYHAVKVKGLNPRGDDLICPDHGGLMSTFKPRRSSLSRGSGLRRSAGPKRSKGLKRTQRRETGAEQAARIVFNEKVRLWPCFFEVRRPGHRCAGVKDAHHLVEKQWIRRNYADLPHLDLVAILFDPRIGAPLCRDEAHEAVGKKHQRIYWDELTDECKQACREVDDRWLEVPTTAGIRRESMVVRLQQECPERVTPQTKGAALAAPGRSNP